MYEDYEKIIHTEAAINDDALGPVSSAGTTFDSIWAQYATRSDIDSGRLMVAEFVRLTGQEAYQRRGGKLKMPDEIIILFDSVESG